MANSLASRGVFLSGSKTVTTAGTAVALASAGIYQSVLVIAKDNNTGRIYVGGSDVASTTNRGLAPGSELEVTPSRGHIIDLTDTYINSSVDGEGVDFYASN